MNTNTIKQENRVYDCLKRGFNGIIMRVSLQIYDNTIDEYYGSKLLERLQIRAIIKVGINHGSLRWCDLYYANNLVISYSFDIQSELSFISTLLGLIDDCKYAQQKQLYGDLLFLGKTDPRVDVIWGLERNDKYRSVYEFSKYQECVKYTSPIELITQ